MNNKQINNPNGDKGQKGHSGALAAIRTRKGDVICVDRGLYKHYGVYIGWERVVHFASKEGSEINFHNAVIYKSELPGFLKGANSWLTGSSINIRLEKQLSALFFVWGGKCPQDQGYGLVFNNCEHFAF